MAKQERYFIGPSLLSDIRETITRVDSIAPKTSGARQDVRLQELQRPGLRLSRGTFAGAWAVGETKAVTIQGSENTVEVTNYCVPVDVGTASTQSFNVVFASVMGTQTAVEVEQSPAFRICTFTGSWAIDTSKTVTLRGVTATPNTLVVQNLFATINGSTSTSSSAPCAVARDGSEWYLIAARCP